MIVIGMISFALILALFYSLDLMYNPKRSGYFVKSITFFLISTIPEVLAVYFAKEFDEKTLIIGVFFPVLVGGILVSLIGLYIFYRRFKRQNNPSIFVSQCITFADLLKKGWDKFKEEVLTGKEKNEKGMIEDEKSILNVLQSIGDEICVFISDNYKLLQKQTDPEAYAKFVVENFISNYMSHTEARCILRKRNENRMVCIYCTQKTKKPITDIDLQSKNLISLSAEQGCPKIYSRNVEYHQDTNGSLKKGVYNDYVTYCLAKDTQNNPTYSIAIDVRGREAQKKLIAIVDSSLFKIICDPVTIALGTN
jgi:hypothetical protein